MDSMQDDHTTSEPSTHTCNACGKRFYLASLLTSHIRNVHERPVYACEYCAKHLASRVTQRAHQWDCQENPRMFTQDDLDKLLAGARMEWERDRKRAREDVLHADIVTKRVARLDQAVRRSSLAINEAVIQHHT